MARPKKVTGDRYHDVTPTRIRELLDESHMSQNKVAELLHVSRQTVSVYADGTVMPPAEKLIDIAKLFNVTTDWLLGLADQKNTAGSALPDSDTVSDETMALSIKRLIRSKTGLSDEALEMMDDSLADVINSFCAPQSQEDAHKALLIWRKYKEAAAEQAETMSKIYTRSLDGEWSGPMLFDVIRRKDDEADFLRRMFINFFEDALKKGMFLHES